MTQEDVLVLLGFVLGYILIATLVAVGMRWIAKLGRKTE